MTGGFFIFFTLLNEHLRVLIMMIMKTVVKILLLNLFVSGLLYTAMAQNRVIKEVNPFDKVVISDNLKVVFRKADKENVILTATGIDYDKIVVESSGRELKIKLKTGIYSNTDINIQVDYVKIRSIDAGNNADVKFEGPLMGDQIELKSTGGAVINLSVESSAIKASLNNGGRIEISGKTDLQEVDANLGSKYNAYALESVNGFVKSNTTSDVVVWVTNKLEANAGSKAELKYRGKPAEVKSSTSLGGKITGDL